MVVVVVVLMMMTMADHNVVGMIVRANWLNVLLIDSRHILCGSVVQGLELVHVLMLMILLLLLQQ